MSAVPKGYKQVATPNYTPEQIQQFQALLGQVGQSGPQAAGLLGKLALGDDSAYQAMARPALNHFNQQLLPEIANRFSSHGAQDSTYFRNAAAGAAGNLTSDLAAQRANIQQTSLQRLLGLEGDLLNYSPYNYGLQKKKGKFDKIKDYLGFSTDIMAKLLGAYSGGGYTPYGDPKSEALHMQNGGSIGQGGMVGGGAGFGMDSQGGYDPSVLDNMYSDFLREFDKRNGIRGLD